MFKSRSNLSPFSKSNKQRLPKKKTSPKIKYHFAFNLYYYIVYQNNRIELFSFNTDKSE